MSVRRGPTPPLALLTLVLCPSKDLSDQLCSLQGPQTIPVSIWTTGTAVISHGPLNTPRYAGFMLTTLLSPFPSPGFIVPPKPGASRKHKWSWSGQDNIPLNLE